MAGFGWPRADRLWNGRRDGAGTRGRCLAPIRHSLRKAPGRPKGPRMGTAAVREPRSSNAVLAAAGGVLLAVQRPSAAPELNGAQHDADAPVAAPGERQVDALPRRLRAADLELWGDMGRYGGGGGGGEDTHLVPRISRDLRPSRIRPSHGCWMMRIDSPSGTEPTTVGGSIARRAGGYRARATLCATSRPPPHVIMSSRQRAVTRSCVCVSPHPSFEASGGVANIPT